MSLHLLLKLNAIIQLLFLDQEHLSLIHLKETKKKKTKWFNLLSPKSDQHEISPYNINALENRVVMRIEYMIREDESNWYFNEFSQERVQGQ